MLQADDSHGSPIRDDIRSIDLREDEDVMTRVRSPAHVTEKLFHEYQANVFVPYIRHLSENPVFPMN
jgi:hypothetical protein